ncbi:DoxX family protein [uncultured Erythrobacter sp.]|uniref:DoxX family protein n=1 Tax=uncultured Erythrobacter sp. TaxID=263913 RepID=UPI002628930A|nr:DoxX family protein [uncultured Erythrobacter sp.]
MIKKILRLVLSAFYAFAGYMHIVRPEPFLSIMPSMVPFPEHVVLWTGIAEIFGAIALLQPFHLCLRQAGGIGLALYALCVWPANINHFILDMEREDGGLGLIYHVPRMFAQPVLIWLALWVGELPTPRFRRSA